MPDASPIELRVMTYNARTAGAVGRDDGPHAWPRRRHAFIQAIVDFAPDVLGLQELMPGQRADLDAALPDLGWWARPDDAGLPDEAREAKLIGFRRDRFTLRDAGTFELSPTPDAPATLGRPAWDARHARWVEWVGLYDDHADRTLHVFNTHLDNVGNDARRRSARLLRERIATVAGPGPAILTGDFNCDAGDAPPHPSHPTHPQLHAHAHPHAILTDACGDPQTA
jgi:endonuclease/exonuclease/phosphatase family metal-dependent hydrolase